MDEASARGCRSCLDSGREAPTLIVNEGHPLLFDTKYSFLDRLLHRLALNYPLIADLSFDLDQATVHADAAEIIDQRHVFVSGLARAGTTTLMRRFYATGRYRSLTYRDMPFVLAPNLWRRISHISRRDIQSAIRAHGDGILVDSDSPESFDEVFWRMFAGPQYIAGNWLKPHTADQELVNKYARYVHAILSTPDTRPNRYLSKNNNNILRLSAIRRAFPNALILIPFRKPLQHAYSLLCQHLRFVEIQTRNQFTLEYMNWLGHYEFGLGHRPFRFDGPASSKHRADTLNYWLQLWCDTYSWLERSSPDAVLFVGYEDLCNRPEMWKRLAELADIPDEVGDPFKLNERQVRVTFDESLADHARTIYDNLVAHARDLISNHRGM